MVVEVLDAQAQAGDPHLPEDLELAFGDGAGLAFERDLLSLVPGKLLLHGVDDPAELPGREERGRAAAEINEARLSSADEALPGIEAELADHRVEIAIDFGGILAGIDLEVAEMAALPAERDVDVDPQRGIPARRAIERVIGFPNVLGVPKGIRRIVGNEVATGGCLFFQTLVCLHGHRDPLFVFPSRITLFRSIAGVLARLSFGWGERKRALPVRIIIQTGGSDAKSGAALDFIGCDRMVRELAAMARSGRDRRFDGEGIAG